MRRPIYPSDVARSLAPPGEVDRVLAAIAGDAPSIEVVRDSRSLAEQDAAWKAAVLRRHGFCEDEIREAVQERWAR
jgi:hypothetical protein